MQCVYFHLRERRLHMCSDYNAVCRPQLRPKLGKTKFQSAAVPNHLSIRVTMNKSGLVLRGVPLHFKVGAYGCRFSLRCLSAQSELDHFAAGRNQHQREFPVLNILPYNKFKREKRIGFKPDTISPRYKRMAINQDWGNVWPAARTFHPASVPLPIHMSYIDDNKMQSPIGKFNNPELLKIPNFLHLTPPVVKRQCEALKKFCTAWPKALKTDEDCDTNFPVTVTTKDFVFSSPSLRWPDSRVVEITVKLSALKLNEHSVDKIKRLLRHRYNAETDVITLRTDSCPLRKQNYEYGQYLLTALYFESWKIEPWEAEKEYSDWERYFWKKSQSRKSISDYIQKVNPGKYNNEEQLLQSENVQSYAKAVSDLCSQKESTSVLNAYKLSVLKLLF